MRKPSYETLRLAHEQADRMRGLLALALTYAMLDKPEETVYTRDDREGWSYRLRLYRTRAAHGGVVIVQAICRTNAQDDSISAHYLDDLASHFPADALPIQQAINTLKIARQRRFDGEREAS